VVVNGSKVTVAANVWLSIVPIVTCPVAESYPKLDTPGYLTSFAYVNWPWSLTVKTGILLESP